MEEIIKKIKEKKEFSNLENSIIETLIKIQMKRKKYNLEKKAKVKELVKDIRAILRKKYSSFSGELKNAELLLKQRKYEEILKLHKSTSERLGIYRELYSKIFSLTGKPKVILDLACGINPLSAVYFDFKGFEYFAYDLSKQDIEIVNEFFKNEGINGRAYIVNLLSFSDFPESDVCFIFKSLDILEPAKGHNFAENLIKKLKSKLIVVSFPKKTLSGKKMTFSRRTWLEKMCQRLGFKFSVLDFENEVFYLIDKV